MLAYRLVKERWVANALDGYRFVALVQVWRPREPTPFRD
jgi:hypothetical protein